MEFDDVETRSTIPNGAENLGAAGGWNADYCDGGEVQPRSPFRSNWSE
jgi:hypothetical protein